MTLAEFITWWRSQLAELVPTTLRGSLQNAKTTVALRIEGNRLELNAPSGDATINLDLATGEDSTRPQVLHDFLAGLSGAPQRLQLTLAPGSYLSTQLTLPRAARAHLAEAVGYQLPQLTPFTADQLLYACGEMPDSPAGGPLAVWLVAVPHQRIAQALALIDQRAPENPLPLRAPPAAGRPLELSWRLTESSSTSQRYRRLAWLGLAAVWFGVIGMHSYNVQHAQAELDAALTEVRARAVAVGDLRDRLASTQAQADLIVERKQSAVSPLLLLDELTQQLDDQTWIQGLDLQGRRLTLRGVSASPATVIESLEGSRLLKEVRFDAAITRDGRGQGDRFNISAELAIPAEAGGS